MNIFYITKRYMPNRFRPGSINHNQSSIKNSNRIAKSAILPITVYPKAAPNVIMRHQIPTLAVLPTIPLCSIEKKKYTIAHNTPSTMIKLLRDSQKSNLPAESVTQTGIIVFINGKVEGFDIVSLNSAYKDIHPKLLKSYAIDSILDRKGKNSKQSVDKAKMFIKKAIKCRGKKYESRGLGLDYRFDANKAVGSALVYSGKVIHTAFFSISESEKTGHISDLGSRKRHRIY